MSEGTDIFISEDDGIKSIPKYVGMYNIGGDQGLCFYFEKKPKWFHRKMMQFCLGWGWRDIV